MIRAQPNDGKSNLTIEVDSKEKYADALDLSSKYQDEEMLVLYYAIDLIMCDTQKVTDALKAVTEYLQKQEISTLGKANLYKTLGCLLMLNGLDSDVAYAMETLKLSLTYFKALKQKRGVAFIKFAILKLYCLKWKTIHYSFESLDTNSELYSDFQNASIENTVRDLGKEWLLNFIELKDNIYQTKTTKLMAILNKSNSLATS